VSEGRHQTESEVYAISDRARPSRAARRANEIGKMGPASVRGLRGCGNNPIGAHISSRGGGKFVRLKGERLPGKKVGTYSERTGVRLCGKGNFIPSCSARLE